MKNFFFLTALFVYYDISCDSTDGSSGHNANNNFAAPGQVKKNGINVTIMDYGLLYACVQRIAEDVKKVLKNQNTKQIIDYYLEKDRENNEAPNSQLIKTYGFAINALQKAPWYKKMFNHKNFRWFIYIPGIIVFIAGLIKDTFKDYTTIGAVSFCIAGELGRWLNKDTNLRVVLNKISEYEQAVGNISDMEKFNKAVENLREKSL